MKTQLEVKKYAIEMYNIGSIYVWGMNSGTTITKESIERAYKNNGTKKYNKSYYDNKLKEGEGKNGSDCSGLLYPLSENDSTAQVYFTRCNKTGNINTLPADKVVLLFAGKGRNSINHVGIYLGDGRCMHMQSSTKNAVLQNVTEYEWNYWGMPKWIDYNAKFEDYNVNYTIDKFIVDVGKILNCMSYKSILSNTITVSTTVNRNHDIVTPLERCFKALGYYSGKIEADLGKKPSFGAGMEAACKQYQKDIVKASVANQDGVITAKHATWKKLLNY